MLKNISILYMPVEYVKEAEMKSILYSVRLLQQRTSFLMESQLQDF